MLRFHPVRRACLPFRATCLLAALLAHPLPAAQAAMKWHTDLASAKAAAAASDRPVLAIFIASWMASAGAPEPSALTSPEAEAVVSACFEPVRIDVDAHPELTRELGVSHVPSVCVIAADDAVLSRFELPASTPEFVAAAAKAAQVAAAHRSAADDQTDLRDDLRIRVSAAGEPGRGNAFATAARSAASTTTTAAAPGSISLVTAKVRELSDFANASPPSAVGSGFRPVATQAVAVSAPQQQAPFAAPISAPYPDPAASRPPVGWRTETASAPPAQVAPPTASRPTLEPAAPPAAQTAAAATASPWLTPPSAATGASAGLTAVPPGTPTGAIPAPALPDTTAPAEPPKSLQSQFLAAIQKPFTFWKKSPEVPKPSTAALAAAPPTLPPARPLPPGAVPGATPSAATTPETPDAYGSMPLGLEGYCPVTLAEKGQWTEGRAQWGARHRGRTYLFAGEDQQRAFLADPDRYAPALSGDDPVLAFESGTAAPGQRRYGVTYQSRMYLFSSPETRSRFAADPTRYTGRVALAEAPARSTGTILR